MKMKLLFSVFVCLLIMLLDGTAGILGLKAEEAEKKAPHMSFWVVKCNKPSHDAFVLGFAAMILVLVAHVFASFGSCCRPLSHMPIKILLVLTWMDFIITMALLLIGMWSNEHTRSTCGFSYNRVMEHGGYFAFGHGALAVVYVIASSLASAYSKA